MECRTATSVVFVQRAGGMGLSFGRVMRVRIMYRESRLRRVIESECGV